MYVYTLFGHSFINEHLGCSHHLAAVIWVYKHLLSSLLLVFECMPRSGVAAFAVPLQLQFRMKACVAWGRGEGFSLMRLGRLLPEAVSQQCHRTA